MDKHLINVGKYLFPVERSFNMIFLESGASEMLGIVLVLLPRITEYNDIFDRSTGYHSLGFLAFRKTPGASWSLVRVIISKSEKIFRKSSSSYLQ